MKKKLILIIPISVLTLLILVSIMLPHWLQGKGTTITVVDEVSDGAIVPETTESTVEVTSKDTINQVEPNTYDLQYFAWETQLEEIRDIKKIALKNKEQMDLAIDDETFVEENKETKVTEALILNKPTDDSEDKLTEASKEEGLTPIPVELPEENQEATTWIDEQLKEYEGQIDEVDINTAMAIMNKLDIDYLNGLAANGLTVEERTQVKAHLNQRLSGGEYATALALYKEYIGLIQ